MSPFDEKEFNAEVKKTLDDSVERMDPATLGRLQRARQAAIHAGKKPSRKPVWYYAIPSAGVATVVVAVLIYTLMGQHTRPAQPWEDLEILASSEKLELYENLEFYAWLAEEEDDAG